MTFSSLRDLVLASLLLLAVGTSVELLKYRLEAGVVDAGTASSLTVVYAAE